MYTATVTFLSQLQHPHLPLLQLRSSTLQATKTETVSQFLVPSRLWIHPSSNQNCDGVAVSGSLKTPLGGFSGSLKTPQTLAPRRIL